MNFSSFLMFLLLFKFASAAVENQNSSVKGTENPSDTTKTEEEQDKQLASEIGYPSGCSEENDEKKDDRSELENDQVNEDRSSGEGVDENDVNIRNQYIAKIDLNPEDISRQKTLPFIIQTSNNTLHRIRTSSDKKDDACLTIATRIDFEKFYVADTERIRSLIQGNPHLAQTKSSLEDLISKYNDFVFTGYREEKILLFPTCPMDSSGQIDVREKFKSEKKPFEAVTLNILQEVKITKKMKSVFWPSTQPCKEELQLSSLKIPRPGLGFTLYKVGYVVKFKNPVQLCGDPTANLMDDMLFFHLALFGVNEETGDTTFSHHFIPFYNIQREIEPSERINTYEFINNIYPPRTNFHRLYDDELQQKGIFEQLFPKNFQKYFNPSTGLVLVKQELIDQRMLPLMSYKQVALTYMNIVPMYQVIQHNTWSRVEEAVSKIPWIDTVTILAGTYDELQIENTIIRLDDGTEAESPKKTVTVPYAFYKLVIAHAIQPKTNLYRNFGIIIITHNNPFETETKKICEDKDLLSCEKFSSINVEQINPQLGLTYCCQYSRKMAESLKINESSISVSCNFDLKELREFVGEEVVRSSSTLRTSGIDKSKQDTGLVNQIFTGLTGELVSLFSKSSKGESPSNTDSKPLKLNSIPSKSKMGFLQRNSSSSKQLLRSPERDSNQQK